MMPTTRIPKFRWSAGRPDAAVAAILALTAISAAISPIAARPAAAATITEAFTPHQAGAAAKLDHAEWDRLLKAYVRPAADGVNRVDYKAFKAAGHSELKAYVKRLEGTDVLSLDRPEQLAYWANLYNAKTVDIVLDHYPVASIREIALDGSLLGFLKKSVGAGGPWKARVVTVAGQALSLDNIEHDILRPLFKDPRIHYAINCASYGCPNLMAEAFTGPRVEALLDAGARAFVNHPRGFEVKTGKLRASSIYDWFQADFGGNAAGVLAHAARFAGPELQAALAGRTVIDSYDYDWKLNDVAR